MSLNSFQDTKKFIALLMPVSLQTLLLVIGEFSHYYIHCRMSTSRNRLVTILMPSSSLLNSAVLSKPEGGWTENLWDATELRYRSNFYDIEST